MPTMSALPQLKPFPMSESQRKYLRMIRDYVRDNKVSPSYDTLAELAGLSKNSPRQAISKLMRRGYLRRGPGRFCNLVVTPAGQRILRKG